MTTQHSTITDPQVHEPKGASSAAGNTVYVSDGAGSGGWSKVSLTQLNTTALYADIDTQLNNGSIPLTGKVLLTAKLDDVSTPGGFVLLPIPQNCSIVSFTSAISGPITAGDAIITYKNGGVTLGTSTISFGGSSKGNTYTFTPGSNQDLVAPTFIEVSTDGGSSDSASLYITVLLTTEIN